MIRVLFQDTSKNVALAVERATFRNLGHAAATIRNDAIGSIVQAEGPSRPGTPPHTHTGGLTKKGKIRRGQLQRAITFDYSKSERTAVIGPRATVVGTSGAAHEFGGVFKGQDYPVRAFMGPALERNLDRFAEDWRGSIGE